MVFVRTLFLKDTRLVYLDCNSLEDCRNALTARSGVPPDQLIFYKNGKRVFDGEGRVDLLEDHATLEACLGLPGGKGGFGSMLRALGAQIEKTTNREACRDLSGRRLRDINEETRLKKFVNNAAEREKEKKEKKEAKLNKLRKIVDPKCDGGGKHEFHDPKYNKEREEVTERVHDAIEAAFSKPGTSSSQNKQMAATASSASATATATSSSCSSGGSSSPSSSDSSDKTGEEVCHVKEDIPAKTKSSEFNWGERKRKADDEQPSTSASSSATSKSTGGGPSKPKKGLWVGDGLTESDLEDSSDEEEARN